MGPYNHEDGNIVKACGFTRDEIQEYSEYSTPTLILEKCPKRFLCLQVETAVDSLHDDKLKFIVQNSKFRKLQIAKISKHVHPELSKLVQENAEDLVDYVTTNLVLFSFATWHYELFTVLNSFYTKKSKAVEFLESNYTKEELLLVLSYAFLRKQKALIASKLLEGKKDKDIAEKLMEVIGNNLADIKFEGKDYTEEELQITPWSEEKINRDIDQNVGNPEWLKATNTYNLFGAHSECAKTTTDIGIVEGLDMVFESNEYTDIEKALHLENIIWNVHKHCEKQVTGSYAIMKMIIELHANKLNWRHHFALHDRVGRVLLLKENKPTKEDILYIIQDIY